MKKPTLIIGMTTAAGIIAVNSFGASQEPQTNAPTSQHNTQGLENSNIETDSIIGAIYDDLDEVIVTGVRPIVTTDGATTTYNVKEDPSASGTTLLDMLRKVPMVTVDGEDNIKLKGESNFKILVNGKEDPTLSANASQIFKMMPANAVSKIEVITEPGAKYDAEGTGGVINLVTFSTQSQDGYNVGIQANAGNRMAGGSVNARMKTGRVTLGANVNYANGKFNPTEMNTYETTLYTDPSTGGGTQFLVNETRQKTPFQYLMGGLKFSWEPTEADLLSFDASITNVGASLSDMTNLNTIYEPAQLSDGVWGPGAKLWYERNDINGKMTNFMSSAALSYQHNFSSARHFLALSYQFSYGSTNLETDTWRTTDSGFDFLPLTLNRQLNINREHTAQIDYTNDFNSEKHLLETGAKAILRHNSVIGNMATGEDKEHLSQVEDNRTDLTQIQNILALYASYTGTFGPWVTKAGVRYENTKMGNRYHIGPMQDFTRKLNDIVPNAAVSYSFSPTENLRLAYQMRISRPTAEQISPYEFQISNFSSMQGNPNLKSEHSNNVSLTYSNFSGVIGGNIGIEYTQIDNAISQYWFTEGDRMIRTYANIGKRRSGALNGFLHWSVIPRMSIGLNGRLEYVALSSVSPRLSNHGWSGNIGLNWSYKLISGWNFTAYGGVSSRRINLQGHSSGWHYYGIAASKDLLKDRSLNVGISANNFLEKSLSYTMDVNTPEAHSHSISHIKNWNISLSVSWQFGGLSQDVKKTSANIQNDDRSTVSGGSLMQTN